MGLVGGNPFFWSWFPAWAGAGFGATDEVTDAVLDFDKCDWSRKMAIGQRGRQGHRGEETRRGERDLVGGMSHPGESRASMCTHPLAGV